MRIKNWTLAAFVACGTTPCVLAQDPLDELYGRAVHAFFRGDSFTSEELLDEVIAAGSQDPRVYFFRGLSAARNGNLDRATADYQLGANLEISGKRVVNVGKALERIQGPLRVELEKTRTQARLESRAKVLELNRARYESLQKRGGVSDGGLVVPPGTAGVRPAPLAPNDPFVTGMTQGDPTPVESAPVQSDPAFDPAPANDSSDPFGSAPSSSGSSSDPFSEDPGTTPAADDTDDPFAF